RKNFVIGTLLLQSVFRYVISLPGSKKCGPPPHRHSTLPIAPKSMTPFEVMEGRGLSHASSGNCMLWNDQVPTLKNISSDTQDGNNNKLNFYLRLAASDMLTTIGGHAK
ncbi:S-locus receptor kinase, partial [Trifolium pratense]